MDLDYVALGERMHLHRKEKGFTQSYLAEQKGCSPKELRLITDTALAAKRL